MKSFFSKWWKAILGALVAVAWGAIRFLNAREAKRHQAALRAQRDVSAADAARARGALSDSLRADAAAFEGEADDARNVRREVTTIINEPPPVAAPERVAHTPPFAADAEARRRLLDED